MSWFVNQYVIVAEHIGTIITRLVAIERLSRWSDVLKIRSRSSDREITHIKLESRVRRNDESERIGLKITGVQWSGLL